MFAEQNRIDLVINFFSHSPRSGSGLLVGRGKGTDAHGSRGGMGQGHGHACWDPSPRCELGGEMCLPLGPLLSSPPGNQALLLIRRKTQEAQTSPTESCRKPFLTACTGGAARASHSCLQCSCTHRVLVRTNTSESRRRGTLGSYPSPQRRQVCCALPTPTPEEP